MGSSLDVPYSSLTKLSPTLGIFALFNGKGGLEIILLCKPSSYVNHYTIYSQYLVLGAEYYY